MNQTSFPLPKTLLRACVTTGAIFATMSVAAWGQELSLTIDFAGEPGNQTSTAASFMAPGISGGIINRGPGINATAGNNSINSNSWNTLNPEEDYLSIRFEVDTELSFDLAFLQLGSSASATGPGHLGLFYNGDGFTENLFTINQPNTFLNSQIDLSSLTNLTGEVVFRIVPLSDTRADGNESLSIGPGGTFRVVNYFDGGDTGGIHFYGTVIPEPSTYAAIFGVLALAGAFAWRRRRASK